MAGYFVYASTSSSQNGPTPEVQGATENADTSQVPTPVESTSLESKLFEALRPYPGLKIGVSVDSINSDSTANISKDYPFIAASTTKVLIATYTYAQAEQGKINLDSVLPNADSGKSISFRDNIRWMIVQSDNESWKDLMVYFGYDNYQAYVNDLGFGSFKTDGNTISANDMAGFLKELYSGKLINSANLDELKTFMIQSWTGPLELSDEYQSLPKKTGWLEDRMHIVGVIGKDEQQKSFAIYIETTDGGIIDYEYSTALINDLLDVIASEQV